MKIKQLLLITLLFFGNCKNISRDETSAEQNTNVVVANGFVDIFYLFDRDSLTSVLSQAEKSQPEILYYQKWAECGNYEIIKRHIPIVKNDSVMLCPVTVKDDLMAALQIDFNVTDTFHITILDGKIRAVTTSSNDPDEYYNAKEWVKQHRPELIEKPCEGIWAGGPTPCECIQGMVKGFTELKETEKVKVN